MKVRKIASLAAFPLMVGAIGATAFVFRRQIWDIFATPEGVRAWVDSWGVIGPLVFVGLQAAQVIVFVIPGEIPQIAGGYLFGFWGGVLLSTVGIAIGSTVGFYIARLLGVPFVRAIFQHERVERLERLASSSRSVVVFLLLFLIPGIPKDILCYVAGLSRMKFPLLLFISTAGRLPGIVGSVVMGDAAAARQWILAGAIFLLAAILFVVGLVFRERIQSWLEGLSQRPHKKTDESGSE
jgi:uncharacterized membrane protein YdjX (TVP38/TMEM64 family)